MYSAPYSYQRQAARLNPMPRPEPPARDNGNIVFMLAALPLALALLIEIMKL